MNLNIWFASHLFFPIIEVFIMSTDNSLGTFPWNSASSKFCDFSKNNKL